MSPGHGFIPEVFPLTTESDSMQVRCPRIDGSCFIHEKAVILGNVEISRNCSVWPFAVIRGDHDIIRIEEGSNVQDGAIIHVDEGFPVVIGKNVTLGHGAVIHGARVGDNCIIGIRSTLLNGSVIGEGSIIGAGAVVPPNTRIPPNSMVLGIPGKVKRTDPAFADMARENAEIYRGIARKHMEGLYPG